MPRKLEPQIVGEISVNLGGKETMFGDKMAAALTPLRHACGPVRIEKYHGFRGQCAALGGSERENVDARHPGRLRRRGVEAR